ncbi:F0F1 ATP synthase subunit delta [[Mycoplasma] collis]|uniref:F0F1 ATP synthase subunit delta n=1 Tax=[Mycoplasma] collis TaxID=2127 RepID=UPI00051B76AA|nr:F0F1 ATP synthase subunit delta [[Mycoplasma] collis]
MNKIKVTNYANALFSIAQEENKLEKFLNEFSEIVKIFFEHNKILVILSSFNIDKEEKDLILNNIFNNFDYEKLLINFLKLLAKNNFINSIFDIFNLFKKIAYKHLNIKIATVYSTRKLTDKEIEKIKSKIEQKNNYKLKIFNKIDKTLIAGIRVEIDNVIIENSITSKLENIKNYIMKEWENGV